MTISRFDADRLLRHVVDVSGMPDFFFEAAVTESKIPGIKRSGYSVAWPAFPSDPGAAYGYNKFEVRTAPANASEVWRYDMALDLSRCLSREEYAIVWSSAHSAKKRRRGAHWTNIGKISGMPASSVKRSFERSMVLLFFQIVSLSQGRSAPFDVQ